MAGEKKLKNDGRLRDAGIKLTPQRLAVLQYLQRVGGHLTAEQIGAGLNGRFACASRATVYNSLRALRDAGLIRELRLGAAVTRYEMNFGSHHHFVCRGCGLLEDVGRDAINVAPGRGLGAGYTVETCEAVLRGLCAACGEKA